MFFFIYGSSRNYRGRTRSNASWCSLLMRSLVCYLVPLVNELWNHCTSTRSWGAYTTLHSGIRSRSWVSVHSTTSASPLRWKGHPSTYSCLLRILDSADDFVQLKSIQILTVLLRYVNDVRSLLGWHMDRWTAQRHHQYLHPVYNLSSTHYPLSSSIFFPTNEMSPSKH